MTIITIPPYWLVVIISIVLLKKRENYNRVAYSDVQQLAFVSTVILLGTFGVVLYNILVGVGWISSYIFILAAILLPIVSWGRKDTEERTKSPVDHTKSCGYVSMRINPDDRFNKELEMVRRSIQEEILDWGSVDGLTVPLKRLKKRLDIPEKLKDMIIKKFIERSKGKFQAPFFEIKSDIVDMRFDNEKDALVFDLPS